MSLIQASSMAITFQHKIALRPGSVFRFGTISSVADEEGILHRIADPLAGCAVGPKTPTAGAPGRGLSSIQASSMAVTFQHKIILRPGSVFCFETISSVADEEGTLHRIVDPPERKSSSKISEKIGAKQGKAQPPALRAPTAGAPGRGLSSIQASSMAVTFQHKIILRPGSVFCFETISSVADEEGTLHRIVDPPERKSSSKISEKIGAKQGKAQPPALREKITFSKLGAEGLSTRRTPLSTSPTEKWTRITRRKEANEAKGRQAALSVPPSLKEDRKKIVVTAAPFYPVVLFIGGRVESNPISDDEPTAPGEEPLHREKMDADHKEERSE